MATAVTILVNITIILGSAALILWAADFPQMAWFITAAIALGAAAASEIIDAMHCHKAAHTKKVLCVDMDGTLCRWHSEVPFDYLSKPENEYFLRLDENENLLEAVKELRREGYPVMILSAVLGDWAAEQKAKWLDSHGLHGIPAVFIPYGKEKAVFVDGGVLLDDFSQNLHAWEDAGFVGIKFYNGVNGNHGTWHGESVRESMPAREIHRRLVEFMKKEGNW